MQSPPNVVEAGRVLATLDDWRAILFVAVILIVLLAGTILMLLRANAIERREMSVERQRLWSVADKFGNAAGALTGELQVQQALNARVESALGRVEEILERGERG